MPEIPLDIREANVKIAEYYADQMWPDRASDGWQRAFKRKLHNLTIELIFPPSHLRATQMTENIEKRSGASLVYAAQEGERLFLMGSGHTIVAHPNRAPFLVDRNGNRHEIPWQNGAPTIKYMFDTGVLTIKTAGYLLFVPAPDGGES